MSAIGKDIKQSFLNGNYLTRLIYINLAFFVLVRLADVAAKLFFNANVDGVLRWLEMPAELPLFASRCWTIVTYMFLHFDFLHLIFNVLFLYWFGRIFLNFFNEKQLVGVYLLGGIFGGIFYLLAYNLLPYYHALIAGNVMLGASASALAVAVASATAAPYYTVRMLFFGEVRLQYLVFGFVLLDLLSLTASSNQGGHLAHLGGAFSGYLFVKCWTNGTDLTRFFSAVIDFFVNLFQRKPKLKVTFTANNARFTTEQDYRDRKARENRLIDEILDKIKRSGYDSLSADEKKALFDRSQR